MGRTGDPKGQVPGRESPAWTTSGRPTADGPARRAAGPWPRDDPRRRSGCSSPTTSPRSGRHWPSSSPRREGFSSRGRPATPRGPSPSPRPSGPTWPWWTSGCPAVAAPGPPGRSCGRPPARGSWPCRPTRTGPRSWRCCGSARWATWSRAPPPTTSSRPSSGPPAARPASLPRSWAGSSRSCPRSSGERPWPPRSGRPRPTASAGWSGARGCASSSSPCSSCGTGGSWGPRPWPASTSTRHPRPRWCSGRPPTWGCGSSSSSGSCRWPWTTWTGSPAACTSPSTSRTPRSCHPGAWSSCSGRPWTGSCWRSPSTSPSRTTRPSWTPWTASGGRGPGSPSTTPGPGSRASVTSSAWPPTS